VIQINFNSVKGEIIFSPPLQQSELGFFCSYQDPKPKEYRMLNDALRGRGIETKFAATVLIIKAAAFSDYDAFWTLINETIQAVREQLPNEPHEEFSFAPYAEGKIRAAMQPLDECEDVETLGEQRVKRYKTG